MKPMLLTRRSLVAGASCLPLMSWPAKARAAASFPKRLVIVTSGNGTSMTHFWPQDPAKITGSRILEPLQPLASKLIIMRGIDSESAHKAPVPPDHDPDYRNLLTARQPTLMGTEYVMTGISIDQHIANAVGKDTKLASLHLGGGTRLHSRGFNQPVPAEGNVQNALKRVFGDLVTPAPQLARQRQERVAVYEVLAKRMAKVKCQVGSEDRLKLEAHVEAVRDLERRAQIAIPSACRAPTLGADGALPEKLRAYMDLTVAALSCDATRVATIDLDNGGTEHTWVKYPGAGATYHGGIAHDGSEEGFKKVAEIERWTAEQFFYLINKMNQVAEGDGTLLDHSLVVWMKEQANGSTHSRRDYPVVIAGAVGGALKTGRLLHANGKPHSGLLMAFANLMDVPTAAFGDPDFSKGPLAGL